MNRAIPSQCRPGLWLGDERATRSICLQDARGAVCRAVVYNIDMKVPEGLSENAIESPLEIRRNVVARNNYGDIIADLRVSGHGLEGFLRLARGG